MPLETDIRPVSAAAQPVYVYGIVRRQKRATAPLSGIAGAPVGAVGGDGLAALASTLPAGTSFADAVADPEQAKAMVLAHHEVLQQTADRCTVLPLRFGTVFSDRAKISQALHAHRATLAAALARLDHKREWGVKIFCDRARLGDHLDTASPAMRAAREELTAAPQGRAFFLQRRIQRLTEEEIEGAAAAGVADARARLCEAAQAEAALKLQAAVVHGHDGDMVWNGAYLVAASGQARFFAAIEALRHALGRRGFSLETNGPWPPFSFADCRLVDETDDHSNRP